jgi:alpha-D-ribose 1-methylphosphonate 5-triphosphate synthase subunit PhnH
MTKQQMLPGFADPVHHSQQWYRALLNAMSRPGTVCAPCGEAMPQQVPAPCSPAAAGVALTLLDHETPVWLQQPESPLAHWLQFHCGCPLTHRPEDAAFAVITDSNTVPDWSRFATGTPEYPDRSATLIIQVQSAAAAGPVTLQGPGTQKEAHISVSGLADAFWTMHQANAALFPQGTDTILAAPEGVLCLPRTVHIRRQTTCM